jgi:hypothetical protein
MLIHGVPLLDVKVGVWCAVGANSGPTFFWALNAHLYVKHSEEIVTSSLITREPLPFCFSKTVQRLTPQSLLFFVYKIFYYRIISNSAWTDIMIISVIILG